MLPVPVTVVNGFLGAGKTTLINRILAEEHGLAVGVIVNDVGAINVDAALMNQIGDEIVSLRNGCVCCSMQGDLIAQVARLANSQDLDHIIIEASGVSEPGNIVRALKYPKLRGTAIVSAVVTLVDAELYPELQGSAQYLAKEQLAAADLVLLNKADLVSSEQLVAVANDCACPGLPVIQCRHADVPLEIILAAANPRFSGNDSIRLPNTEELFDSTVWWPSGPVCLEVLRQKLQAISNNFIRVKGFVRSEYTGDTWLVQVVGRRINLTKAKDGQTPALILIGMQGCNDWQSVRSGLDASVVDSPMRSTSKSDKESDLSIMEARV